MVNLVIGGGYRPKSVPVELRAVSDLLHKKLQYIAIDASRRRTAHDSFLQAQSHLEKVSLGRPCMIASSLGEVCLLVPHRILRQTFEVKTLGER
jgi:hypothetical protein